MNVSSLFRLGHAMRKLGGAVRRVFTPLDDAADVSKSALPSVVKSMLPPSVFTKRLTRSRAKDLRRALSRMTAEQRAVAYARGWAR